MRLRRGVHGGAAGRCAASRSSHRCHFAREPPGTASAAFEIRTQPHAHATSARRRPSSRGEPRSTVRARLDELLRDQRVDQREQVPAGGGRVDLELRDDRVGDGVEARRLLEQLEDAGAHRIERVVQGAVEVEDDEIVADARVDLVRTRGHDGCERERRLLRQHPSRRILSQRRASGQSGRQRAATLPGKPGRSRRAAWRQTATGSGWNLDHDVVLVVGPASQRCRRLVLRHRASEQVCCPGRTRPRRMPGR